MGELYGLIGHPIGHSLSPVMQEAAFKQVGLHSRYQAFDVTPEQLSEAITGMTALGIKGFNVTVPHKVAVIDYLDAIDEEAKLIGAVNTVVIKNGKLTGYNTDGAGFVASLESKVPDFKERRIVIIGAGGAARAVAVSLALAHCKRIDIANRSEAKAKHLSDICAAYTESQPLTLQEAAHTAKSGDIIINTTPIGMYPNINELPITINRISEDMVFADLIYNPLMTKWLKEAAAKGAMTLNGVGMFVNQGVLAFERWTGITPDRQLMEHIVMSQLEE